MCVCVGCVQLLQCVPCVVFIWVMENRKGPLGDFLESGCNGVAVY